jgi:hypothetical protein
VRFGTFTQRSVLISAGQANLKEDGFEGTAPVGSFPPNGYGLNDQVVSLALYGTMTGLLVLVC